MPENRYVCGSVRAKSANLAGFQGAAKENAVAHSSIDSA
jgi:hypothetical protein